jgi:hypothetical protein
MHEMCLDAHECSSMHAQPHWVHNLQLAVLIHRRKCTTAEKSVLMLQLLELVRDGGVAHTVCAYAAA